MVIKFLGYGKGYVLDLTGALNYYNIQLLQECYFIHYINNKFIQRSVWK